MDSQHVAPVRAGNVFSRIHLIVVLAMCFVVAMLAWTTWSARSLVLTFVPQVNAAMQSRISVTEAHLWLEEIVSGDASENPQQVWDKIDEARWHLTAMLDGGDRGGKFYVKVVDAGLRADLLAAQSVLAEFEQLARTRVESARSAPAAPVPEVSAEEAPVEEMPAAEPPAAKSPAEKSPAASAAPDAAAPTVLAEALPAFGVGSDIDQRFDDTFEEYFAATQRAEQHLNSVIDRALSVFITTQIALMCVVAGLFGWIVWLLLRKESTDRDAHVSSLQESLDRLAFSQQELERQNALRGAMVEIADSLQGLEKPADIARVALDVLCARSGASVGICWGYRAGHGLTRLAAYALPVERADVVVLADGDGLAGRAALEQQPLAIDVPSDYLSITSGLGASAAPHLRVLPLVHDRMTAGVIELAFINHPDADVAELLVAAAPAIAVRLHMAARSSSSAAA